MVVATNNNAQMVQRYCPPGRCGASNVDVPSSRVFSDVVALVAMGFVRLALNASACVTRHERFDLLHAHAIDVADDRVLETRRRRRELERLLVVLVRAETVNQAGSERIAAADAVDDVRDVVVLAREERLAIVQHGAPAVAIGAVAFAKCDDLLLKIWKLL